MSFFFFFWSHDVFKTTSCVDSCFWSRAYLHLWSFCSRHKEAVKWKCVHTVLTMHLGSWPIATKAKFMTHHVIHEVESNHKVNEKEHWACRIFKVWFQRDIWVAVCSWISVNSWSLIDDVQEFNKLTLLWLEVWIN